MGKKKGSKKGSKAAAKSGGAAVAAAGPTPLELSLRLELEQLEKDILVAKRETEEARTQNEFLHEEISRTTVENSEYEAYILKKTRSERSQVVALSDVNQRDIDAVEAERVQLENHYDRIKKDLNDAVVARESELERTRQQIDEMKEVEGKRSEQEKEISELEGEISRLQQEHFERLQDLKSKFLQEKADFQAQATLKVAKLEERAPHEAVACLTKTSTTVKAGNRRLRNRLLNLMAANKELRRREEQLQEENAELSRQSELDIAITKAKSRRAGSMSAAP
eukprot:m.191089 g.191089  ORF g.191089 m.191089 type:complete len:281 (+) comp24908_c3_seq1:82-924(+)